MSVSLLRLPDGAWATVDHLPPGEAALRLEAMGLRPGKRIQKISGMPFHGPVTVCLDGRQFAIGHGIALRLAVTPERQDPGDVEFCT